MNILGEGFPESIVKQVEQRQKIYGSGYASGTKRTNEELVYLNSNTSWVKLVSSVDIIDQKVIQDRSLSSIPGIDSSELARKFVLFNGVWDANSYNQRGGISDQNNYLGVNSKGINSAYGIGGTDFGIRPMMGIQSTIVKFENRGSLKRATVKLKAFNKVQFDIIDVLYLRLGFNMLLEWGHSMYYDNAGVFQAKIDNSLAIEFLNGVGKIGDKSINLNYKVFLTMIRNKRITSNGNYDAMFAKVSNFHWSFLPDGSYDITIDLVSIGDIIESFKINSLVGGLDALAEESAPKENLTNAEIIALYANKSTIGQEFYKLQKEIDSGKATNEKGIAITYGGEAAGKYYFIRLGYLLQFIQTHIMYVVKSKGANESLLPFDYNENTNIMFIDNLQISVDPTVCVVNRTLNINGQKYTYASKGKSFESPELGVKYGRVMNIYFNMSWILTRLDELKEPTTNKTILINFLNSILSDVNSSLGGSVDLEATINEDSNTVIIRDKNPIPNIDNVISIMNEKFKTNISSRYAYFDLYGYSTNEPTSDITYGGKGHASFIKDFNFITEISPKLSTMITIGAAANSVVVGENSTAFSKFNNGLADRYKEAVAEPTLSEIAAEQLQKTEDEAAISELFSNYTKTYLEYINYIRKLSDTNGAPEYNGDSETYKDALANYNNYLNQARQATFNLKTNELIKAGKPTPKPPFNSGTGFIPFNLSLTMDGLSGMKIYSKFFIDSSFLPANYPDTAEFLIKGIEHRIENNKWTTNIESFVITKSDTEAITLTTNIDILPASEYKSGFKTGPTITYLTGDKPTNNVNGKWAAELRKVIARLGYIEKGNEIDNGGDISENIYKASAALFTTIKSELPTLQIRVTGGNDLYHQNLSYVSRHKNANALDFTISPSTPANLDAVVNILQRYAAGNNPNFRFIDEYRNLTAAGTANHIHISWGAGTESQKELNKALALLSQGKISPIKIA
jgi:hypothetical protein